VRPLVFLSLEVPVGKTLNHFSVNRFHHFGVSAPGKPKGEIPRLHKSQNHGTGNPDVL
jgi:hypothetical protein